MYIWVAVIMELDSYLISALVHYPAYNRTYFLDVFVTPTPSLSSGGGDGYSLYYSFYWGRAALKCHLIHNQSEIKGIMSKFP